MKWRRRPRRTNIVLLLTLGAVGTLALTGCGESSRATATPATASTPPSNSSTELIAQADAICKRLNDQIAATSPGKRDSPLQLSRNALQHAALERKAARDLSRLTPPKSLAHDWAQMLAYVRRLSAELATLGRYWKLNETQGIRTLAASKKQVHQKLSAIASRDCFKDCSHI
jgi:hypothetical protein